MNCLAEKGISLPPCALVQQCPHCPRGSGTPDSFACHLSCAVVSVCSEKNPCKNGGHCVDVANEEELMNVGVKNGGKSRQIVVRKYSVSRCICRYGFSGQLCQHGKSTSLFYLV